MALLLCAPLLLAQAPAPPPIVSYQGTLFDASGAPLDGFVDVDVSIWDAAAAGTPLFTESHSDVDVREGVFRIGIGSVAAGGLPAALFANAPRWLEIAIDGETLAPRQALGSVPWALVSGSAQRLGDFPAAEFVREGEAASISAGMIQDGAVDTGTLAPAAVTGDKIAPATITPDRLIQGPASGLDADSVDGLDSGAFRRRHARVIVVDEAGSGDFDDVQAAVNSIVDASASRPYLVRVLPGGYGSVQTKAWVDIEGSGRLTTELAGLSYSNGSTEVRNLRIVGPGDANPVVRMDPQAPDMVLRDVRVITTAAGGGTGIRIGGFGAHLIGVEVITEGTPADTGIVFAPPAVSRHVLERCSIVAGTALEFAAVRSFGQNQVSIHGSRIDGDVVVSPPVPIDLVPRLGWRIVFDTTDWVGALTNAPTVLQAAVLVNAVSCLASSSDATPRNRACTATTRYIDTGDLATEAVSTSRLRDGAVTTDKLASNIVAITSFSQRSTTALMAASTSQEFSIACPANHFVIGGGWDHVRNPQGGRSREVYAYFDKPSQGSLPQSWQVGIRNNSGGFVNLTVLAFCMEFEFTP